MTNAARTKTPTPAEITLDQLGPRACAMLGAHAFTVSADGRELRFQIRGSRKVNTIVITLDASDTYTVAFWKIAPRTCKKVSEVSVVYADALRSVIETYTGLYTSL